MVNILCAEPEIRRGSERDRLAQDILERIEEQEVISLDGLVLLLPQYTWNQIFHAVDQLAREGWIVLRRHGFDYALFSADFAA